MQQFGDGNSRREIDLCYIWIHVRGVIKIIARNRRNSPWDSPRAKPLLDWWKPLKDGHPSSAQPKRWAGRADSLQAKSVILFSQERGSTWLKTANRALSVSELLLLLCPSRESDLQPCSLLNIDFSLSDQGLLPWNLHSPFNSPRPSRIWTEVSSRLPLSAKQNWWPHLAQEFSTQSGWFRSPNILVKN